MMPLSVLASSHPLLTSTSIFYHNHHLPILCLNNMTHYNPHNLVPLTHAPWSTFAAPVSDPKTPRCSTCRGPLGTLIDMQRSTGRFWKNCKRCRDKRTESNRKKRNGGKRTRIEVSDDMDELRLPKRQAMGGANAFRYRSWEPRKPKDTIKEIPPETHFPNIDVPFERSYAEIELEDRESKRHTELTQAELEQIAKELEDEEDTTGRECSVCAETFPPQDFPSLMACSHEANVCQECFITWLDQRMASTTWEQIACPSNECTSIVSHADVKMYASAETFAR
jgi:hypothetical protein